MSNEEALPAVLGIAGGVLLTFGVIIPGVNYFIGKTASFDNGTTRAVYNQKTSKSSMCIYHNGTTYNLIDSKDPVKVDFSNNAFEERATGLEEIRIIGSYKASGERKETVYKLEDINIETEEGSKRRKFFEDWNSLFNRKITAILDERNNFNPSIYDDHLEERLLGIKQPTVKRQNEIKQSNQSTPANSSEEPIKLKLKF